MRPNLLSVIVPAYDERESVARLMDRIHHEMFAAYEKHQAKSGN